jgi:hypothetical protein
MSGAAFAQMTKYNITVSPEHISKDNLELATRNVPNFGRHLTSNGFDLILDERNQEAYVQSLFESKGIPVLSVVGDKTLVVSSVEKAGGNNCSSAEMLCSNTSQTGNSSGPGTQELNGANQGCMSTEHQSSWYYLNVQTGGTLTMTISPTNGTDDYDWAIWGPFTTATAPLNCPPVSAPIRCSWSAEDGNTGMMIPYWGQVSSFGCGFLGLGSCNGWITTTNNPPDNSEGEGGDAWTQHLNTNAGEVYILLVDNFTTSSQPYNMSFGGTTVLGCNVIILPVGLLSLDGEKTSGGNMIHWETETEQRSNYFAIEWSTNPIAEDWREIGTVFAAGTSEEKHSYNLLHANPANDKINYYRLTLVDLDGKRTVYNDNIISVNNTAQTKVVEHIYNMMGQEVDKNTRGIVIYQYTDGSTQKVFLNGN